ncbi:DUF1036 domain-containing protein [Methyloceanibacter stevinii]|uniref:DUF1036 domain-containing protein n=1 Tax=Methyloceanibacter stevinii TaxID=1774970 RepID=UPI00114CE979|nr:DUF1036 domain-containing protein [Methyloceanibacter stevinii]
MAAGLTALGILTGTGVSPANADLKLCNTTASRVGVAIGYKDTEGWASEGWWNIASHTCETLLKGVLIGRYYYIHAVDYDRGGEWAGGLYMCTDDKSFTIRNTTDCEKRGHKRTGFFEVDTGEERDWTVRLTDPEGEAKNQGATDESRSSPRSVLPPPTKIRCGACSKRAPMSFA